MTDANKDTRSRTSSNERESSTQANQERIDENERKVDEFLGISNFINTVESTTERELTNITPSTSHQDSGIPTSDQPSHSITTPPSSAITEFPPYIHVDTPFKPKTVKRTLQYIDTDITENSSPESDDSRRRDEINQQNIEKRITEIQQKEKVPNHIRNLGQPKVVAFGELADNSYFTPNTTEESESDSSDTTPTPKITSTPIDSNPTRLQRLTSYFSPGNWFRSEETRLISEIIEESHTENEFIPTTCKSTQINKKIDLSDFANDSFNLSIQRFEERRSSTPVDLEGIEDSFLEHSVLSEEQRAKYREPPIKPHFIPSKYAPLPIGGFVEKESNTLYKTLFAAEDLVQVVRNQNQADRPDKVRRFLDHQGNCDPETRYNSRLAFEKHNHPSNVVFDLLYDEIQDAFTTTLFFIRGEITNNARRADDYYSLFEEEQEKTKSQRDYIINHLQTLEGVTQEDGDKISELFHNNNIITRRYLTQKQFINTLKGKYFQDLYESFLYFIENKTFLINLFTTSQELYRKLQTELKKLTPNCWNTINFLTKQKH